MAPVSFHNGLVSRRSILTDTAVLLAAPAIVRAAKLMPISRLLLPLEPRCAGYVERLLFQSLRGDLRCGQMTTWLQGEIVSEKEALRIVSCAQGHGFLPA